MLSIQKALCYFYKVLNYFEQKEMKDLATVRKTKSGKTGVTRTKNVEQKELFKCPFCMRDLEKRYF